MLCTNNQLTHSQDSADARMFVVSVLLRLHVFISMDVVVVAVELYFYFLFIFLDKLNLFSTSVFSQNFNITYLSKFHKKNSHHTQETRQEEDIQ